jgi:hypothetical protein
LEQAVRQRREPQIQLGIPLHTRTPSGLVLVQPARIVRQARIARRPLKAFTLDLDSQYDPAALPDGNQTVDGQISLGDVIAQLRRRGPVFPSEADLRHSFARVLREPAPDVLFRLEVPQRLVGRTEYLDLLCVGPSASVFAAGRTRTVSPPC